jgi:hypothetical protein
MEIKLNGYNLNDTSVKTNEIQFDTAPPIEVQQLDIAGSDGSKFVTSRYGTKIIKILGYITAASQSALETALDTFKQSILDQENIELVVSYAGGYRQFIGNVSSFIWTKRHHNITFQPFEIEFTVGDPPFAYSVSTIDSDPIYEEAFSAKDFTGNSLSHTLTFEGTAKPKAKWTYLLNTISGQTAQLVFKSKTTGKQMEINAAFTPGDQIEIDQEDYSVRLNGFDQDYDGVFPEFERGANELEWQVYGTGLEKQGGIFLDQNNQLSGSALYSRDLGQTFTAGATNYIKRIELLLQGDMASPAGKSFNMYLTGTLSGKPDFTNILASANKPYSDVGNKRVWVAMDIDGVTVTNGEEYAIIITNAQNDSYNTIYMVYSGGNPYSGGALYRNSTSATYVDPVGGGSCDASFKVYLSSTVSTAFNHTSSLKIEYKRLYL